MSLKHQVMSFFPTEDFLVGETSLDKIHDLGFRQYVDVNIEDRYLQKQLGLVIEHTLLKITPINPPIGSAYIFLFLKTEKGYACKGFKDPMSDLMTYHASSTSLKELIMESTLPFKDFFQEFESEDDGSWMDYEAKITPEEWEDIHHKFHGFYREMTRDTPILMKAIGDRFPKRDFRVLYRGVNSRLFEEELESSFPNPCGEEEYITASKLSPESLKYLKLYTKGMKSWTKNKSVAYGYAGMGFKDPHRIVIAWVKPSKKDIYLDSRWLMKAVEGNPLYRSHTGNTFNEDEVVADPKGARILGIRRKSSGNNSCEYTIILTSQ